MNAYLFAAIVSSEDIRDIRGPIHIPYPWLWIVYVFAGLIFAALLYWLYWWWKNRRPAIVLLPHEIALEQLREALKLMNSDQAREFSIAVSQAIRSYIEARFHVHAANRTTEEFLHDLLAGTDSPLKAHSTVLDDFLRHCDLAKFARWSLSPAEMQSMHESAKKFVEETRERPENSSPPASK